MKNEEGLVRNRVTALAGAIALMGFAVSSGAGAEDYEMNDSHFHLTNYVQQGISVDRMLEIMGSRTGRVALFGIPLQQTWSFENSGEYAPTYYLQSDAPLYYYSFTDAYIAMSYLALPEKKRDRFDPMITGFNPADMYAADHIRRVLETFPGVFSGIGEFTIHKEFVSSKVAGNVASLTDPALDRILEFAGEAGLVVILHSDLDVPFVKAGAKPIYLDQMNALLRRHPATTIIWAHVGLGRVINPVQSAASAPATERSLDHLGLVEAALNDASLNHVYFDISWDEVAKYIVATDKSVSESANLINRFPQRFLFGTDVVAPSSAEMYYAVFDEYQPLWDALTPEASELVRKGNYERLFDEARRKVRAWEAANVKTQRR
ncbi:MAG: amidohydrolase family protein [Chromatiales bacterium]|jgi:predicted TIM-barrel fold metal-dependent hydrolase